MAHDRWPPARILASIRSLARRQRPLGPAELKRRYAHLVVAARRFFGSWLKAVIAAGVDPAKLRRAPPWTRERIIEAILARALKNQRLSSHNVQPRSLANAAERTFGSWEAALATAGLDPKQYMSRLPGGDVGAPARSLFLPEQQRVRSSARDEGVPGAAGEIAAAPIRPGVYRTSESVLQAILTRLREQHLINAASVYRDDRPLYRVAERQFGNWRNALKAAGLNPEDFSARRRCNGGESCGRTRSQATASSARLDQGS
jgi:hypothetical protein